MQVTARIGGVATVAAGATAGAIFGAAKSYAKLGAELDRISRQTGIAVENLTALKFAAARNGVEFDDLVGSVEEFNVRLGETLQTGKGPMSDALKQLNLDAESLSKMPVEEAFGRIGDELNKLTAEHRGFMADEIFGGDGFKILPLLQRGSAGIKELTKEASRLGLVMSGESAAAAAQLNNRFMEMQQIAGTVFAKIGEAFAPMISNALAMAGSLVSNWQESWAIVRDSSLLTFTQIIEAAKHAFTEVIPAYAKWFGENFTNIARDVAVGYVTALKNAAVAIKDIFVELWNFIRSGFEGGFGGIMNKIGEIAGRNMLEGFEAQTKALPKIAARQVTDYEKRLRASIGESAAVIAADYVKAINQTPLDPIKPGGGLAIPALAKQLPALAKKSFASAGSFNVSALNRSLPNGEKKIAENTKLTADRLKQLIKITERQSGPTFS